VLEGREIAIEVRDEDPKKWRLLRIEIRLLLRKIEEAAEDAKSAERIITRRRGASLVRLRSSMLSAVQLSSWSIETKPASQFVRVFESPNRTRKAF